MLTTHAAKSKAVVERDVTLAAWTRVVAGYREALILIPLDHPERPVLVGLYRDAARCARLPLLDRA